MEYNYIEMRNIRLLDMDEGHERPLKLLIKDMAKSYSDDKIKQINFITERLLKFCDQHVGLNSSQYMAHPIRVAQLVYGYQYPNCPFHDVQLALAHNYLEVSSNDTCLAMNFLGIEIFNEVEILTIDREKRWDDAYLTKYYNEINKCHLRVKLIKCCDKFDNLFLLQDNKSFETKNLYLNEIDKFVIPMAKNINNLFYRDFQEIFNKTKMIINEQ